MQLTPDYFFLVFYPGKILTSWNFFLLQIYNVKKKKFDTILMSNFFLISGVLDATGALQQRASEIRNEVVNWMSYLQYVSFFLSKYFVFEATL